METKKSLRDKLQRAVAERDSLNGRLVTNRTTYIKSEHDYQARIKSLSEDLIDTQTERNEALERAEENAHFVQVNLKLREDERVRRVNAEKEAEMLRGIVDYFIARHRLDYSEEVEGPEIVATNYKALAEDVALSSVRHEVVKARQRLGLKG